jgi:hypothetical protein
MSKYLVDISILNSGGNILVILVIGVGGEGGLMRK